MNRLRAVFVLLVTLLIGNTLVSAQEKDTLINAYERVFSAAKSEISRSLARGDYAAVERWLAVVEHELDSMAEAEQLVAAEARALETDLVADVHRNLSDRVGRNRQAFREIVGRGDVHDAEWRGATALAYKDWLEGQKNLGGMKWRGKGFLVSDGIEGDMTALITNRVAEQLEEDLLLTGRLLKNFKKISAEDAFHKAKQLRDWAEKLELDVPDEVVRSFNERETRLARMLKQAEVQAGHEDAINRLRALAWEALEPDACEKALDALVLIRKRWAGGETGLEVGYRDLREKVKGRLELVEPEFFGPKRAASLRNWKGVYSHEGLVSLFSDKEVPWATVWTRAHGLLEYRVTNASGAAIRLLAGGDEFWVLSDNESRSTTFAVAGFEELKLVAGHYEMGNAFVEQSNIWNDAQKRGGTFVEWVVQPFVPQPVSVVVLGSEVYSNAVVEVQGGELVSWRDVDKAPLLLTPGTYRIRLNLPDHEPVERAVSVVPGDKPQVIEWGEVEFKANGALRALRRLKEGLHSSEFFKTYGAMTAAKRGVLIEQLNQLQKASHLAEARILLAEMEERLLRNRSREAATAEGVLEVFRSYPYQVAIFQGWENHERPQKLRDEAGVLGSPPMDALLEGVTFSDGRNDPIALDILRSRYALWRAYLEEKTGPDRSMQRKYAKQFKALGQRWIDRFPGMARQCFYDALALEVDEKTRLSFSPGTFEKLIHGYLGGRTFPKGYTGIGPEDPELLRIGCHLNYYARGTRNKEYLSLLFHYLEVNGVAESGSRCNEFDVLLLLNYFYNIHGVTSKRNFDRTDISPARLGAVLLRVDDHVGLRVAKRLIQDADEATMESDEAKAATQALIAMLGVLLPPENVMVRTLRKWRQETPARTVQFSREELSVRRRWLDSVGRKKLVGLSALSVYESGTGKVESYVAVAGQTGLKVGDERVVSRAGQPFGRIKLVRVFRSEGWPKKTTIFEAEKSGKPIQRGDYLKTPITLKP